MAERLISASFLRRKNRVNPIVMTSFPLNKCLTLKSILLAHSSTVVWILGIAVGVKVNSCLQFLKDIFE